MLVEYLFIGDHKKKFRFKILLIIEIDIKVHQRVIFIVKETKKKMLEILHPLEEEILSTNKYRVDLK